MGITAVSLSFLLAVPFDRETFEVDGMEQSRRLFRCPTGVEEHFGDTLEGLLLQYLGMRVLVL